jgi:hypothetical protein
MNSKRLGDLQTVENTKKVFSANDKYNFIRVQLEDGEEVALLFTDNEVKRAKERAMKNPEDLPKTSKFRDLLD